ncbi:MAG TPA: HlyD family efflux transporter periplasmic adaptor subunit [Polyangia bacterium]
MSSAHDSSPYRRAAIAYHGGREQKGALLRLSPGWARWAYWLLLATVIVAGAYSVLGRAFGYASGPAVIRIEGRVDLTAKVDGTVASVSVQPGQRVSAGQPLVRFFMEQDEAELERLQKEFDLQLLRLLRDPADNAGRESLSALRAQRELAVARLEQHTVRAPRAGVVSDVRIRPGQHLAVGEWILTIVGDDAHMRLVALLPGRYRPMLKPGLQLRFELVGYRYEYRELHIDSIGDEIIGPAEAKRYLGPGVADTVALAEPVVLVSADLPTKRFFSEGESYQYFDGLPARAEARVRSEPMIYMLVPALKALWSHGR